MENSFKLIAKPSLRWILVSGILLIITIFLITLFGIQPIFVKFFLVLTLYECIVRITIQQMSFCGIYKDKIVYSGVFEKGSININDIKKIVYSRETRMSMNNQYLVRQYSRYIGLEDNNDKIKIKINENLASNLESKQYFVNEILKLNKNIEIDNNVKDLLEGKDVYRPKKIAGIIAICLILYVIFTIYYCLTIR